MCLLIFSGCNFPEQDPIENGHLPTDDHAALDFQETNNSPLQNDRIQSFTISAPQLGNRIRNIQVYLPPDYESSGLSYPVIYLHDGGALFNPPPESVGDWLIDETLDDLYKNGLIDGIIVVGIEFDRENLWSEYSPWVNTNMHDWVKAKNSRPVEGGEGDAFLSFIIDTLKPEVDSRYRTLQDRDNTMIGGSCEECVNSSICRSFQTGYFFKSSDDVSCGLVG